MNTFIQQCTSHASTVEVLEPYFLLMAMICVWCLLSLGVVPNFLQLQAVSLVVCLIKKCFICFDSKRKEKPDRS